MKPNDIVHDLDPNTGAHLFWKVVTIYPGEIGQESLVRLVSMSQRPMVDEDGHTHDTVLVPTSILMRANLEVFAPTRHQPELPPLPDPSPRRNRHLTPVRGDAA